MNLSNFGNLAIFSTLLITLFIIIYSIKFLNSKDEILLFPNKLIMLSLFQTTISITSFFSLLIGFIISDFSLLSVYQNSHTLKPIFYKISGTWGNHEGSMLLWINIMIIFAYLFIVNSRNAETKYRIFSLLAQNVLIFGFLFFLFANSNPFSLIFPIPKEGLGLNPILQDPALAIHPPLLYVGFVGSSIYFSAAIGSLLSNYKGKAFANSIKVWVMTSWIFQTLGITFGSIWAYYELGWGGFWFWDPVENASLMPWFVMTALFHSLLVLEKRETLYYWVIILCLLTFTLSVTGTFLVRSGILNSVHTFANDPSRGLYILIFLSIMIITSTIIFLNNFRREKYNFFINSKETFILSNNWFMMFYLGTVLIGTVYPIFTEVLNNLSISVGPPYYNSIIIPLLIPFLFLMAIGPQAKWIKNEFKKYINIIIILAISIFANLSISYLFGKMTVLSNLIIISSLFLISYTLIDLVNLIKRKIKFNIARIISHLGFGFLILSIGINYNFSLEKDFNLKVGDQKSFDDFNIRFISINLNEGANYKSIVGKFKITENSNLSEENLYPEIRIYNNSEMLTHEASIKSDLVKDLYLTMSNINRSDLYNIKFQKKPFMIFIWVSSIMICCGGIIRLIEKKK